MGEYGAKSYRLFVINSLLCGAHSARLHLTRADLAMRVPCCWVFRTFQAVGTTVLTVGAMLYPVRPRWTLSVSLRSSPPPSARLSLTPYRGVGICRRGPEGMAEKLRNTKCTPLPSLDPGPSWGGCPAHGSDIPPL